MLNLEGRHRTLVVQILSKYPYNFYVFGSRVKEKAGRFSDLDLFCYEQIPIAHLVHLQEEFEESDLPFKVDIICSGDCDASFRDSILGDLTPIGRE